LFDKSYACPLHSCTQGVILERIRAIALAKGKKRFIYLGNGKGDYCPSLKLSEEDYAMPRKNFHLWELICADTKALRAEVHDWRNAEELEAVLLLLIHKAISIDHDEVSQLLLMACKFHTIPMSAHEAHPQALPVPHLIVF